MRGEESIAELCRRGGIASNLYYRWSKEFFEAGKKRLNGDAVREATSDEVKFLRSENRELKKVVAEMTLKNRASGRTRLADRSLNLVLDQEGRAFCALYQRVQVLAPELERPDSLEPTGELQRGVIEVPALR